MEDNLNRRQFFSSVCLPIITSVSYPTISLFFDDDYNCVEQTLVDQQLVDFIFSKRPCTNYFNKEDCTDIGYLYIADNNKSIKICTSSKFTDYQEYADVCWNSILASCTTNNILHMNNHYIKNYFEISELNGLFHGKGKITDLFVDNTSIISQNDVDNIKVHKISLNNYKDFIQDKLNISLLYNTSEIVVGLDLSDKYNKFIMPVHKNMFGCYILNNPTVLAELEIKE